MRSQFATDCLAGAVSGVAATYLMGAANDAIQDRQSEMLRKRERELEPHTAPQTLALKLLGILGEAPSEDQITFGGKIVHWTFGISMGAAYPPLRRRLPWVAAGAGLPYALVLYAMHYYGPPALGLSPPSEHFPAGTRLRGFAYHLVYGTVLAIATSAMLPDTAT